MSSNGLARLIARLLDKGWAVDDILRLCRHVPQADFDRAFDTLLRDSQRRSRQ